MTTARWWQPTAILDATRIGGQNYSQAEVRAVTDTLMPTDYGHPLNVGGIALSTGVGGRTVRQIISDLDGRVMLIGKRNAGLFVCHYADQGEPYTLALDRHWRSERDRVHLRGIFAGRLPRLQGYMFDPVDYDELDDDEDDL